MKHYSVFQIVLLSMGFIILFSSSCLQPMNLCGAVISTGNTAAKGILVDTCGNRIPFGSIQILPATFLSRGKTDSFTTQANYLGGFSMGNLKLGTYRIVAFNAKQDKGYTSEFTIVADSADKLPAIIDLGKCAVRPNSNLSGTVSISDGSAPGGAVAYVPGTKYSSVISDSGTFFFPQLPPGNYTIHIDLSNLNNPTPEIVPVVLPPQTHIIENVTITVPPDTLPVAKKRYTLTTDAGTNGTIALNPAGGTYPSDSLVTVTAIPYKGYSFTGWSGDLTGSVNPETITMTSNKSIVANFRAPPNLIRNGDFSQGMGPWEYGQNPGSVITIYFENGECYVDIQQDNGDVLKISMQQRELPLIQGKPYTFNFEARAERPRDITIHFKDRYWHTMFSETKSLSTLMQKYTMDFTCTQPTDTLFNVQFYFGGAGLNDLWIDNVLLKESTP